MRHEAAVDPTLLVLAAGMGSRYGGLKQLDGVGPGGATLLDYAVHDACRSGFGRVVFLVRKDFAAAFESSVLTRFRGRVPTALAFQEVDRLPEPHRPPEGRTRPWGTGHAVWCAREVIGDVPFAVINADDFYGADAFRRLAGFLREAGAAGSGPASWAMAGFSLGDTLSEHGAVARGVCTVDADGRLVAIEERTGLRAVPGGAVGPRADGVEEFVPGSVRVSMNCWAFDRRVFEALDRGLRGFLEERGGDLRAEFYLPAAVGDAVARGDAVVRVIPTTARWFGLTHPADRPRVAEALAGLVASGEYPERPWT